LHAVAHVFLNSPTGRPAQWKINSESSRRAFTRRSMIARSSPTSGRARPYPVFASFA
jgi:hypothetical protein